jgi:hypothetical protein
MSRDEALKSVDEIQSCDARYHNLTQRFEFIPHSWFANAPLMGAILNELKPALLCEVGSWMGASARFQASFPFVQKLICVDHWDRTRVENWVPGTHPEEWMDNMYEHFMANTVHAKLHHKIYPLRMDSAAGASYLAARGMKFDWIYLDGAHATVGVTADIQSYLPLLAANGLLCGDDWTYATEPENVRGAVMEMATRIGAQVHAQGNFWWYTFPGKHI